MLLIRRSVAFACLALVTTGCTSTRRLDPPAVIRPDGGTGRHRIIGATLKDGRDMRFDVNASTVVSVDTLRTSIAKQATLIPVADLQNVWVTSTNAKKTTLVLVGLGALYLAIGAMAAQSIDYGPWPTN
jgi:hypothetical protein